jgi:hypothetical protein
MKHEMAPVLLGGFPVGLWSATMFLGAFLVFLVQPMIARQVLPLLGGSPAVWVTCMVFFQAALLCGYSYAHAATTRLDLRRQTILQAGLVLLPLLVLPIGIPPDATRSLPSEGNPTWWLLGLLVSAVGLPFFALSTTAPVLQKWFAYSGHRAASDPYFLYGASNLGSLLALVAYPAFVEPNFRLGQQSMGWSLGFGCFVALMFVCILLVWKRRADAPEIPPRTTPARQGDPLRASQFLRWIVLAFVPSSMMLGVTMYMTTDIAAIPLLWVIPLAIYLLTFALTFARRPVVPHSWVVGAFPMAAVVLTLAMGLSSVTQPFFLPLHLLGFFLAAMVCHGELVRHRPPTADLTAFYLALSLGGVLGGLFNALIAPMVFDRVAEYPLALVLACLCLPRSRAGTSDRGSRLRERALLVLFGATLVGAVMFLQVRSGSARESVGVKLALGFAALVGYSFKERPTRFALGIGAILVAAGVCTGDYRHLLYQHRNYFGVLRVSLDPTGSFHVLIHGQTVHGRQSLDPGRRREPLTYYHRTGPIGQVFDVLNRRGSRASVGLLGLGAGTLACYAEPGQRWTFYEIDPAVAAVARDHRFFTFLEESRAALTEVILGDGRLKLAPAPEHGHDLIVLDAFSSDAIPTHLLTREAVRLYLSKLKGDGLLAFHISNSYIDLAPVLGSLARDAGLTCLVRRDLDIAAEEARAGKSSSAWGVMSAHDADLGALLQDTRWERPPIRPGESVWTDDFSNLVEQLILRDSRGRRP